MPVLGRLVVQMGADIDPLLKGMQRAGTAVQHGVRNVEALSSRVSAASRPMERLRASADRLAPSFRDLGRDGPAAARAVTSHYNQAADAARRFNREVRESSGAFTAMRRGAGMVAGGIGAFGASVGVGEIAAGIWNVNRSFESLSAQLEVSEGSALRARMAFAGLEQFATRTPFQVDAVTQAFSTLRGAGIEPTMAMLTAFGDLTSTRAGKDITQFAAAVQNALTGEFERLKEFGIVARQAGDNLALTFRGQTTVIERTAAALTGYLQKIGESQGVQGSMAGQMKTLNGVTSNLGDAFGAAARQIGEAGFNDAVRSGIQRVTLFTQSLTSNREAVNYWTGAVIDAGKALGQALVFGGAVAGIMRLVAAFGALKVAIAAAGSVAGGLAATLGTGGLAALGVGATAAGLYALERKRTAPSRAINEAFSSVEAAIPTMDAEQLRRAIQGAGRAAQRLAAEMRPVELSLQRVEGSGTALEARLKAERDALKKHYDDAVALAEMARERLKQLTPEPTPFMLPGLTVTATPQKRSGRARAEGPSMLDRMEEQARTLAGIYDALKARMADTNRPAAALVELYGRATAALARMGDALSADRLRLEQVVTTLREADAVAASIYEALARTGRLPVPKLVPAGIGVTPPISTAPKPPLPKAPFDPEGAAAKATFDSLNQGARELAQSWAALRQQFTNPGETVRAVGQMMQGAVQGIAAQLAPLGVVATFLSAAMEAVRPAVEALLIPIQIVGAAFGKALAPVLQAMWPIFRGVAIAATFVGQVFFAVAGAINVAIGSLIRGIGNLLNKLPGSIGDPLKRWGQQLIDIGRGFQEGARELGRAREELRDLDFEDAVQMAREGAQKIGETLTNIPPIFDHALRRAQAAGLIAASVAVAPATVAAQPSPLPAVNISVPGSPTPRAPAPASGRSVTLIVNINNPAPGVDAEATRQNFMRSIERELQNRSSPLAVLVADIAAEEV